MGSIQQQDMLLSYQPELVRMHNVINGGRQSLRPPPGGSPFRDSHNNNANTWSNMYRSQPCGRWRNIYCIIKHNSDEKMSNKN